MTKKMRAKSMSSQSQASCPNITCCQYSVIIRYVHEQFEKNTSVTICVICYSNNQLLGSLKCSQFFSVQANFDC